MMLRAIFVAAICVVAHAISTHAQEAIAINDPRGHVGITAAVSNQPHGRNHCPDVCGTFGGGGGALIFSSGFRASPRLRVGLEIAATPAVSGPQTLGAGSGSGAFVTASHHDLLVNSAFSTTIGPVAGRTLFSVTGLAGLARRDTVRQGRIFLNGRNVSYTDKQQDYTPTIGAGVDFSIAVHKRLSFGPMARIHYVVDSRSRRGISSIVTMFGARVSVGIY